MFGAGQAEVTYLPGAPGLKVTSGSPFTAKLDVILTSDDGKTATVDIDLAPDEPEHEVVVNPGGFTYTEEAEMPPSVIIPLTDGMTTPYSESLGSGKMKHGKTGTITLHSCPAPAPGNSP